METLEDRLAPASVAYDVPAGTVGTQNFGGSLGMDFNVASAIVVNHLGAFDSQSGHLRRGGGNQAAAGGHGVLIGNGRQSGCQHGLLQQQRTGVQVARRDWR